MSVPLGRSLIGKIEKDADLLNSLTDLCRRENIRVGSLTLIGSVSAAHIGYYNQVTHKYIEIAAEERWEIASCLGNISIKENDVSVHAHIIFSDDHGKCIGGHLLSGTKVFAAEYHIQEIAGVELVRQLDTATGLSLWS